MRLLIDECLPRRLKGEFTEHETATVQEMGWSGMKNGMLLAAMRGQFDAFMTIDGNLQYQQNLSAAAIAVIVLRAPNNKFTTLQPLMAAVNARLAALQPGEIVHFTIAPD